MKNTVANNHSLPESTEGHQGKTSLRYGGGRLDARALLMHLYGILQRKKVVILRSDPRRCAEVLAASDTKGTFLEHIIATPSWHPIYSIESMDGPRWNQLSSDFKMLMSVIGWRERLTPLTHKYTKVLAALVKNDPNHIVNAEVISRLVVRILFELLFRKPMNVNDETLFYQASIEWRKEIAVKGRASAEIKSAFWARLTELVADSAFKDGLESYKADPSSWLSLFAQPFLISPQINISDIFVTVFHYLRAETTLLESATKWAAQDDKLRLGGIVLESIRLRHPFPILEREVAGTQFFILLDQFEQDQTFDPERWLQSSANNPYHSIPFAAGPRMCVGKPIAMELLIELLTVFLLDLPAQQLQPQQGHLFSGRNNDATQTKNESRYQAGVFLKGLWQSWRIGRSTAAPPTFVTPPAGCPWKKMTERFERRTPEASP